MSRVFVDTTVFLLAVGRSHALREHCRHFLHRCREDGTQIHVSVEVLQEFAFHRLRSRPREQVVPETRALWSSVVTHPFDEDVLEDSLRLMAESPVRGRDAVHAATAVRAGFAEIVTTDTDFGGVPELRGVLPQEWRP